MKNLSIVVVTKNRALDLTQCLGSLLSGNSLPDEIIVIDNNSIDQTKQLILGLKKHVSIKVKYVFFKGQGYPTIYNKGLKEAKYNWVAFIDDDCIACLDWVSEIKKTIKKYPKIPAIMGWCETHYSKNVYSQATLLFDNLWKNHSIRGENVLDLEILDNKNVVYNNQYLKAKKIKYDEARIKYQMGAAQDCDLGMQIQNAGGQAICNKKMIIHHKDPQNWLWFIKKHISSWKAYQSLSDKWDLAARENLKSKNISLLKAVNNFGDQYHLSAIERLKLLITAKQVMIFNRILPIIYAGNQYEK